MCMEGNEMVKADGLGFRSLLKLEAPIRLLESPVGKKANGKPECMCWCEVDTFRRVKYCFEL